MSSVAIMAFCDIIYYMSPPARPVFSFQHYSSKGRQLYNLKKHWIGHYMLQVWNLLSLQLGAVVARPIACFVVTGKVKGLLRLNSWQWHLIT